MGGWLGSMKVLEVLRTQCCLEISSRGRRPAQMIYSWFTLSCSAVSVWRLWGIQDQEVMEQVRTGSVVPGGLVRPGTGRLPC